MISDGKKSPARKWWLLVGAVVVFVVSFDLLERLVGTDPEPAEAGSPPAEDAGAAKSPAPPELRRLADGAIEIRLDLFRRTTIRLDDDAEAEVLFDCLARGIEEAFGEGTQGWDPGPVRRETKRIQDECMASIHDIPVPPRPGRN